MEHLIRALSHDMAAMFMLLDSSFSQLKASVVPADRPALAGKRIDPAHEPITERFAHVEACLRESKRFLDDLVTLARTGTVQMDAKRIELAALVTEVLFEQRELLAERCVRTEVAAHLPAVWCNAGRAKQVFTNLIRNAVRHGCDPRQPAITITHRRVTFDGKPFSEITIHDNGPGIPADQREAIFRPGHRLPTAHPDGTGTGLSIVKKIVEHYGGQAEVADCRAGMAIAFTLPLVD